MTAAPRYHFKLSERGQPACGAKTRPTGAPLTTRDPGAVTCERCAWAALQSVLSARRVDDALLRATSAPSASSALVDAATRALPLLERLGDLDGNGPLDATRPGSLGVRCDVIADIKTALRSLDCGHTFRASGLPCPHCGAKEERKS